MEIQFQKGEFPIKQVIFINLDSVLGSLLTSLVMKPHYGKIDIIHQLRTSETEKDVDLLMKTTCPVISTCWDEERLLKVLPDYIRLRKWEDGDIRVYELGKRVRS